MAISTAGDTTGRLRRRNRILKLRSEGLSYDEISKRMGVSPGTLSYYVKRYGGSAYTPRAKGKKRMSPIVLGSEVNGSGNGPTLNDVSLLDLLWARLTVEEKVKVMKGLEGKGD